MKRVKKQKILKDRVEGGEVKDCSAPTWGS